MYSLINTYTCKAWTAPVLLEAKHSVKPSKDPHLHWKHVGWHFAALLFRLTLKYSVLYRAAMKPAGLKGLAHTGRAALSRLGRKLFSKA